MNRGIVMEVQKRNVIVMTPGGEFISFLRNGRQYKIGEEVLVSAEQAATTRQRRLIWKPLLLLACSLLIAFTLLYNGKPGKAYAYVSMDAESSLEASVDEDLHVRDLRAYNKEGEQVLRDLGDWKGKRVTEVIASVIQRSEQMGYVKNREVLLTYVATNQKVDEELARSLHSLEEAYTKELHVTSRRSTPEQREAARKKGLTTGGYIKQQSPQQEMPPAEEPDEKEQIPSVPAPPPNEGTETNPHPEKKEQKQEEKEERMQEKQTRPQPPGKQKHPEKEERKREKKEKQLEKHYKQRPQHEKEREKEQEKEWD
ncbi:anti-sigma factor domain-containing protein [Ectobacillus ponti]|uniref:Anti-sigma factor domain-containing protein n=1 Tax=Ectobacillus ponti TaxID=2961894 RepID=A0AA41X134_9BACI|nr:anti-sigma factor domain-containing protein [Ectobacillus ponti]MCP8967019.1 anti-sigma factor domain-containing protein [Ectobacillus ponti]